MTSLSNAIQKRYGPSKEELRRRAGRDAYQTRAICLWCGEAFVGPFAQVNALLAVHRKSKHPERPQVWKNRRRKPLPKERA